MCRPAALSAWIAELETAFLHFSRPQIKVLAQYSYGMILAGKCGLSSVATALSDRLGESFDTTRERLRDFYCDAADKTGKHRRTLDVSACFAPLLKWVLRDWQSDQLAIALDATTLGQRFVVLAISVVYRSGAIPVAWAILPATGKGKWKPKWIELLKQFKSIVPDHLRVIVLADRGLYAKWMFEQIVDLGWHPFLRINAGNGEFTPDETKNAIALDTIDAEGKAYVGRGTLFKSKEARLRCTLAVRHDPAYADGWYVVSDLPPDQLDIACYGLRAWIEQSFRHHKTGGWQWQLTRMTSPDRASHLWLAMAVADVLVIRQGTAAEQMNELLPPAPIPNSNPPAVAEQQPTPPQPPASKPTTTRHRRRRILSVFCLGLLATRAALLSDALVLQRNFDPEPWPRTHATFEPLLPVDQPP